MRVRLIDQGQPATGSTLASTALLSHELDLPLHRLADRLGWSDAARAWRDSRRAVADLARLVRRLGIRCDWGRRQALLLSGPALRVAGLRREAHARRRAGIACRLLGSSALRRRHGFRRAAALLSPGAYVADPVRLALGILDATPSVDLVTEVVVREVTATARCATARTSRGPMSADMIVLATGYALPGSLVVAGLSTDSTWVAALRGEAPLPEWARNTVVWEGANPYHYMRSLPDGRILIGGEDRPGAERHRDTRLLRSTCARLTLTGRRWVGQDDLRATDCWAGAFGRSASGLPVIGPIPGLERVHVAAGFGGNGITHAMLAARLLAAACSGSPARGARLYAPPGPNA
jgi:glycine/D-amino acid oxidase-like deaminating enzyme